MRWPRVGPDLALLTVIHPSVFHRVPVSLPVDTYTKSVRGTTLRHIQVLPARAGVIVSVIAGFQSPPSVNCTIAIRQMMSGSLINVCLCMSWMVKVTFLAV